MGPAPMNTHRTLLAVVFAGAASLSAAAQDKIIWKGERAPTEGSVVNINFTQIKYRLSNAGSEQEDSAKDVKDIEFDTDNTLVPYEYTHGLTALHKGQFKEAVDQFKKAIDLIKKSNSPNHPIRDFCRKYIMEAWQAAGDAQAVVTAARELRAEKADSFFLRDSFLMQYDAAKMKRDPALQDATIKELEDVIRSDRRYQERMQRDADLLRADVLESNKKYADALTLYTRLSGDRELWEEVSLGMLRCLSALGKTADLKTKVENLLTELKEKRESNPRVYLGAIVARGDLYLAENKVKEALLDYMKGALDPGQASNTYEHETAIAKAAMAAARYGKQFGEKDKPNKILYIDRAKEMREELKRTYPATAWMTDVEAAIRDAERGQ
jgi:tetratricopeptide (TPR) repeat protein